MNIDELIEFQEDKASEARANGFNDNTFVQTVAMLRTVPKLEMEIKELKIMRGNSVLVPSNKLAEMQSELEALRNSCGEYNKWKQSVEDVKSLNKNII